MSTELDYIFHPRSIAVVGASSDLNRRPRDFFQILLDKGFQGALYPVNPNAKEISGVTAFPSVEEIPGPVDYVISAIPSAGVPQLVDQCARKGVKVIHCFTARMSETGHEDGAILEQEILRRVRAARIRLIGPNCLGIYNPRNGMAFRYDLPEEPGSVAFLSQSGGNSMHLVLPASARGIRFSKVISYGNATDLNEADFMDYLADDPETEIISAYIEGAKEGHRFFEIVRRTTKRKPVILLKGGRTMAGTNSVGSHTASLAGSREVWETMCRQAGAIPASTIDDLADMLVAFRFLRPTTDVRVGMGGGGGGFTVLSADAAEEGGLRVMPIPTDLRERFRAQDSIYWDWVSNPIDSSMLGSGPFSIEDVLKLMADHHDFDLLIGTADERYGLESPEAIPLVKQTMEALLRVKQHTTKPVAIVLDSEIPGAEWKREALVELREMCIQAEVAVFPTVGRAARAIRRFVEYHSWRAEE